MGWVSGSANEIVITSSEVLSGSYLNIWVGTGLRDNRAQADGSPEIFERLVDGVRGDGLSDETIEREPTRGVEAGQPSSRILSTTLLPGGDR
jgi:hypothetical protein